jgi:hypothetical protein
VNSDNSIYFTIHFLEVAILRIISVQHVEDTPPVNEDEDLHIQTMIERIAELETEIETKKIDLRRMHLF